MGALESERVLEAGLAAGVKLELSQIQVRPYRTQIFCPLVQ